MSKRELRNAPERVDFGARSKREAMASAKRIVDRLIESYFEAGQPHLNAMDRGIPDEDADRLRDALTQIQRRML